jgi:DNA-binding transcriptional MerR regulator
MKSGDLAQRAGVSSDTLRHYERIGVLPRPRRSANGYRQYPPEALDRVRTIRGALAIGFKLDELARVLGARDRGGAPCRQVLAMARQRLERLESQIAELDALQTLLRGMIADWEKRLASTPEGRPARLLEHLPEALGRIAR